MPDTLSRLKGKMRKAMADANGMWDGLTSAVLIAASGSEDQEATGVLFGATANQEMVELSWDHTIYIDSYHPLGDENIDPELLERVIGLGLLTPVLHDRGVTEVEALLLMWAINAKLRPWRFDNMRARARELLAFTQPKLGHPAFASVKMVLALIAEDMGVILPMARWSPVDDEIVN